MPLRSKYISHLGRGIANTIFRASKFSGINARTVDVTLVDNHSQTGASNGHLFFPDRRLASSPPPDGNSRPLCPRRPKDGDRYRRTRT